MRNYFLPELTPNKSPRARIIHSIKVDLIKSLHPPKEVVKRLI